jgi:hypothetical protein
MLEYIYIAKRNFHSGFIYFRSEKQDSNAHSRPGAPRLRWHVDVDVDVARAQLVVEA